MKMSGEPEEVEDRDQRLLPPDDQRDAVGDAGPPGGHHRGDRDDHEPARDSTLDASAEEPGRAEDDHGLDDRR